MKRRKNNNNTNNRLIKNSKYAKSEWRNFNGYYTKVERN